MAIWILEGVQGQGKTTTGAAVLTDAVSDGRDIVTNIDIHLPHTHFDLDFFQKVMDGEEALENCTMFVDEFQQYMSSRRSASRQNEAFSYFIFQVRKRGIDFYATSHRLMNLDVRVRAEASVEGVCEYHPENPCRKCRGKGTYKGDQCDRCLGYGHRGIVRVKWLDRHGIINPESRRKRKRYVTEFEAHKYWHLFDTTERMPIQKKLVTLDTVEVRG